MTRILLTVVLVFLLLNLPRLILGIFEISRCSQRRESNTDSHYAGSAWLSTVSSPHRPTPSRSGSSWRTWPPGTSSSSTAASTSSSTAWRATSSDLSFSQRSPQNSPPSCRRDDWNNQLFSVVDNGQITNMIVSYLCFYVLLLLLLQLLHCQRADTSFPEK